jgi:long-chain acyl-CoA synthetase
VIVNSRTGSVVMNQMVTLDNCAVAHGNLSVAINADNSVSQPGALSGGQTAGVTNAQIDIKQEGGGLLNLPTGAKLADVVKALNAIGAKHSEMWLLKLLVMLLDLFIAFFSFSMSIRIYNHVGYMLNVPLNLNHKAISPAHVAVHLNPSGTPGRPNGAMLTHLNLLGGRRKAAEANMPWNQWGPDDVSLVAMPVGHIGGTGWGIVGLVNGAKGVVAREFDPFKVLDYIEQDRISKMFMVPAALQIVVRQPRAREVDYSRLKYILYGASPIPLDLLRECMEVFGCGFCQQYGMTETCGTIVYLPPEDHDPAGNPRMRAAGLPMPGVEIKIIDEAGNTLPANTVGEVAIRSVSNMAGYWRLPEATASTLAADGWLRSGDAGYLDEEGYLFIHDRVKDMIISGAENIYPAEVESAVYGHPDVAEVAVIGVPDDKWGESVKAVVALKPGAKPDPDDIIAFARTRIAAFKAPKSVDFIDALPRNASGKILRRELREPYWAGRTRRVN